MSNFFRVVFSPSTNSQITSQQLEEYLRKDCTGDVLNNILQSLRIVAKNTPAGLVIEPVHGMPDFGQPEKRATLRRLLESLLSWGSARYQTAAFVFKNLSRKGTPTLEESSQTFDEVISENRRPVNRIVIISDFSRFRTTNG